MAKRTRRVKIQGYKGPVEIEFVEGPPISAHGGVTLLKRGLFQTRMLEDIDLNLSIKKRNRGFTETEYIESLVCMLALGGDRLDDLAQLKGDKVIGELIPTPGADAMGYFLKKMYLPHVKVLKRSMAKGVEAVWRAAEEIESLTLDVDSSLTEKCGHQQGVKRAYTGIMGYNPLFGLLAELEVPANIRLQSGNTAPSTGIVSFIEETLRLYPDLPIRNMRADSASYSKHVAACCERRQLGFTITADQTSRLLSAIAEISETAWQRMDDVFEVAEFRYQPTGWPRDYRFIVTRKRKKKSLLQPSLFADHEFTYHVFVTNRAGCKISLVRIHHDRGNCENLIKELKDGFAAKNMPSQQFMANAAWLTCSCMAMILQVYLQRVGLNLTGKLIRAKQFRFRFLHRACRLVNHARRKILQLVLPPFQRHGFKQYLLSPA